MATDRDLAARFWRLFEGRSDAWGAVHGEAVKLPLTYREIEDHLFGEGSVGMYPLRLDKILNAWACKWGCIDVDLGYEQSLPIAINLQRALKVLGITAWIERTKGKGYHVWTLCSEWVPAEQMVAAQRVACQLCEYNPKEINPKQTSLEGDQLGNYVNLPFARKWVEQGTRVVLGRWMGDDAQPVGSGFYGLGPFLDEAEKSLNSGTTIAQAAALYKPPKREREVAIGEPPQLVGHLLVRLPPVVRMMLNDGPLPHKETGAVDRSAALQRCAYLMASPPDKFTPEEGLAVVMALDSRADMQKYVGRADGDLQYEKIVRRAFQ